MQLRMVPIELGISVKVATGRDQPCTLTGNYEMPHLRGVGECERVCCPKELPRVTLTMAKKRMVNIFA